MSVYFPETFLVLFCFFARETDRRFYHMGITCSDNQLIISRLPFEHVQQPTADIHIMSPIQNVTHFQYILPATSLPFIQECVPSQLCINLVDHQLIMKSTTCTLFPTNHIPLPPKINHSKNPFFTIDYQEFMDICTEAYALRTTIDIFFYENSHEYTFQGKESRIQWTVTSINPQRLPLPLPVQSYRISIADLKRLESYVDQAPIRISLAATDTLVVTQHNCHVICRVHKQP